MLSVFFVSTVSVYWDLDIPTNAVIRERPPDPQLPPHPEVELHRAQLVTKLRQHYLELCHQREGRPSAPPLKQTPAGGKVELQRKRPKAHLFKVHRVSVNPLIVSYTPWNLKIVLSIVS